MHAIRAAHVFDGTTFLAGAATVLIDRGRIAGVEGGRFDVPDGVEAAEYAGTLLPGPHPAATATSSAARWRRGLGHGVHLARREGVRACRRDRPSCQGYGADLLVVGGFG
jgi:hypothetical protein